MKLTIKTENIPSNLRCNCSICENEKSCIHANAFRRFPKDIGGLSLCPKLKSNTDPINEYYLKKDIANNIDKYTIELK